MTLTTTTSENVNKAVVQGVELNVADVKFDFLPGFLSDFGGIANVSFINFDSPFHPHERRLVPQAAAAALFVQTSRTVSLLYSHGRFSGQVTYNYTGKMPISFDTNKQVNDQWWAGISTVDAQIMYQARRQHLSFRVQGKNLFDGGRRRWWAPTQQLNYSTLENGRAIYVGVGVTF